MKMPLSMKLTHIGGITLLFLAMLTNNQVMMAAAVIIGVIQSVGIEILEAIHKRG